MSALINGEPFEVSITFDSDWMCGTGSRRGVLRRVERDSDGFPMVRGKALAALLRDAAETVARGLDEDSAGEWHEWVTRVFGSQPAVEREQTASKPQPSSLVSPTLRLPQDLRAAIKAHPNRVDLAEATVLQRASVRIDAQTGVAADDMFRVEERARAGLTVTGQWVLTVLGIQPGDEVPMEAELLIRAAAKLVTAIGGKRRRGAGRCRVTIGTGGEHRLAGLLDRIDSAQPPPRRDESRGGSVLGKRRSAQLILRHELRITPLSPVLISRGQRGNVVLGEQFIPGSVLLPLVARALGARATELITGGNVVVTDATVEIAGMRSAPTPLSLLTAKITPDGPIVNTLHQDAPPLAKSSALPGFCVVRRDGAQFDTPEVTAHAHAVIDDEQQRPNDDSGGLFIYQALAAGTVLRAQLWAPPGVDIDIEQFVGKRSIGRSRKDDYGHVVIESVPVAPPPVAPVPDSELRELVVWAQSDVLLRGANGQPDPSMDRLAHVLGERLSVQLRRTGGNAKTRRLESWHARWGLPRPSLVALKAGSVVRLAVEGTIDPVGWTDVQAAGIGDRCAEGFGRIALQPAILSLPEVPRAGEELTDLLCHAWRPTLHAQVVSAAADDRLRAQFVPASATASQLGTLRTLAERSVGHGGDLTAIVNWLKGRGTVRTDKAQWSREVLKRLHALVTDRQVVWEWLAVDPPPVVAERLWTEVVAWALAETTRIQTRRGRITASQRSDVSS